MGLERNGELNQTVTPGHSKRAKFNAVTTSTKMEETCSKGLRLMGNLKLIEVPGTALRSRQLNPRRDIKQQEK